MICLDETVRSPYAVFMRMSFHRIAYEALEVCNALEMATIDAAIEQTGLASGARALDIGCGNGAIAMHLAEQFGLAVAAVELDPAMAALARARIERSTGGVVLHEGRSGDVLNAQPPFDLISAIGSTDPVGDGRRDPAEVFSGLHEHLTPGGWLLWGDLVWTDAPPEPLRMITEMNNTYATDAGWRAAADQAGLEVVSAEISSVETWDRYTSTMDRAARDWLAANPDAEEAQRVRASADRVKAMFDFGRPYIGFGLYLLRRATH